MCPLILNEYSNLSDTESESESEIEDIPEIILSDSEYIKNLLINCFNILNKYINYKFIIYHFLVFTIYLIIIKVIELFIEKCIISVFNLLFVYFITILSVHIFVDIELKCINHL